MPEIRWIILGCGALLMLGIWWWGSRKPSQARGAAELRGSELAGPPAGLADEPMRAEERTAMDFSAAPVFREPSISPYAPLRISAAEPDGGDPILDIPIMAEPAVDAESEHTDPAPPVTAPPRAPAPAPAAAPAAAPAPAAASAATAAPPAPVATTDGSPSGQHAKPREPAGSARIDSSGRFSSIKSEPVEPIEQQKIVAIRVCAAPQTPWDGAQLASALSASDLIHGRYGVFHRLHTDGRSVFCVASLLEPGSFEPLRMHEQLFMGVSVFSVLPGPIDALRAFDDMLAAARHLSEQLHGAMQDERGNPLTAARAAALREDVARFSQALPAQRP